MTTKKRAVPAHTLKPTTENRMEKDMYVCYHLNDVTYIPHYRERAYIGPGYGLSHFKTYAAVELLALGAKKVGELLWTRPEHANKY